MQMTMIQSIQLCIELLLKLALCSTTWSHEKKVAACLLLVMLQWLCLETLLQIIRFAGIKSLLRAGEDGLIENTRLERRTALCRSCAPGCASHCRVMAVTADHLSKCMFACYCHLKISHYGRTDVVFFQTGAFFVDIDSSSQQQSSGTVVGFHVVC